MLKTFILTVLSLAMSSKSVIVFAVALVCFLYAAAGAKMALPIIKEQRDVLVSGYSVGPLAAGSVAGIGKEAI
jgi:hypothetical protein